ncbi:MAG: hypothetical protein K0S07_926 [Chlamydiales bacterium]|jgi:hypothetical protein|nr:hypothetical protein [Chlamydiales bacterium]
MIARSKNFLSLQNLTLTLAISSAPLFAGQASDSASSSTQPASFREDLASSQAKAQAEVKQQSQLSEQEEQKKIVPEAVAVVDETKKALLALEKEGGEKEAFDALERAVGKIDILLARHPEKALLPIDYKIEVVDAAPLELKRIKLLGKEIEKAIKIRDYANSRLLLNLLRSELGVHTYCLPLALYPAALKEGSRLLQLQKKNEARIALASALNTRVTVTQTFPLPLINAKALLDEAGKKLDDREAYLTLLAKARRELTRSKQMGYLGLDEEYAALDQAIRALEKQERGSKFSVALTAIKKRFNSFFKRQSEGRGPAAS